MIFIHTVLCSTEESKRSLVIVNIMSWSFSRRSKKKAFSKLQPSGTIALFDSSASLFILGNITNRLDDLSGEIVRNMKETYNVLHAIDDFKKRFESFVAGELYLNSLH